MQSLCIDDIERDANSRCTAGRYRIYTQWQEQGRGKGTRMDLEGTEMQNTGFW